LTLTYAKFNIKIAKKMTTLSPSMINLLMIIGVIIFSLILNYFLREIFKKFVFLPLKEQKKIQEKRRQRLLTIFEFIKNGTEITIWIIATIFILSELGINVFPFLAGMGIVGLVVGMAFQQLLVDFINGFFILLEEQYFIGDKIKIGEIEGKVKELTLRKTIIEDENGNLFFIPNREVKIFSKRKN